MINPIAVFYDLVIVLYYGIECYIPCAGTYAELNDYSICYMYVHGFAESVVGELVHQEIQDGESWSDSGAVSSLLYLGPGDDDSHIQPG